MKSLINYSLLSLASLSQITNAFVVPTDDQQRALFAQGVDAAPVEKRLIQLSPTETKWVTEEEKLELKRVCATIVLFTALRHSFGSY